MPQEVRLKALGLFTNPNQLDLPAGALTTATDVVIRREGIIEPRRGYSNYATETAVRIFSYSGRLFILSAHSSGTIKVDNGSGTFTGLSGAYSSPSSTTHKMRSAEAIQNLYLTTSAGPYRIDATASATVPAAAGALKATSFDRNHLKATVVAGSLVRTGGSTVTGTSSAAHGFYVGQVINMNSAGEGDFANGNKTLVTVPTTTTFTYTEAGANVSSGAAQTFLPAALVTSGGFLADGYQVAYRYVVDMPDANNPSKLGAVSPRFILANASGVYGYVAGQTKDAVLRALLPSGIANTHKVRLYRSTQVATSIEPSDELQLVYEALVNDDDVTRGWKDISDITPDVMRGESIYTAPSQEGAEASNEPPPNAKDICHFKGRMLYGNTTERHRFVFTLRSVGGATGVTGGDVLAIDNRTYTFASPVTGTTHILTETSGSVAQNIRNTALNIVATINRDTANNSAAYYISGPDDPPGRILIERKTLGGSAFTPATSGKRTAFAPLLGSHNVAGQYDLSRTASTVTATSGASWGTNFLVGERVTLSGGDANFPNGEKVVTATTATTFAYTESGTATTLSGVTFALTKLNSSSDSATPNRVFESKVNQPEAVPGLSYSDLGSKAGNLLRLAAMRDSVFAFKEDGLYRGVDAGDRTDWQLFDPTVILIANDSVATLGNMLYALTTQGVVAISDTGVEIVSRPIERTLLELDAADTTNFRQATYAVAYESERLYRLHTITDSGDTTATQCYVYCAMTGAWTLETRGTKHAVVHASDNKLYTLEATAVRQERKAFTTWDYLDPSISVTISSVSASAHTVTLASATGVAVGDVLNQSTYYARVTAIAGNVLTIAAEDSVANFTAAAATIYTSYLCSVGWAPVTGGNAGMKKLFRDIIVHFGHREVPRILLGTRTELVTTLETETIDAVPDIGLWTSADSAVATTYSTDRPFHLRRKVPQQHRRAEQLSIAIGIQAAFGQWDISGVSVTLEPISERTTR